jgi:hypothetical protein
MSSWCTYSAARSRSSSHSPPQSRPHSRQAYGCVHPYRSLAKAWFLELETGPWQALHLLP